MRPRKDIWPATLFAASWEIATFISWMANANPALTKSLLAKMINKSHD